MHYVFTVIIVFPKIFRGQWCHSVLLLLLSDWELQRGEERGGKGGGYLSSGWVGLHTPAKTP